MRRLQLAGHCHRHKEEPVSRFIFWTHSEINSEKQTTVDNKLICKNVDAEIADLLSLMNDRPTWKRLVKSPAPAANDDADEYFSNECY